MRVMAVMAHQHLHIKELAVVVLALSVLINQLLLAVLVLHQASLALL